MTEAFESTPPLAEIHSASRAGETWDAEDLSLAGTGSRPSAVIDEWQLAGIPVHCQLHRPEQSRLRCLVLQHAASFIAHTQASCGAELPRVVKDRQALEQRCRYITRPPIR